MNGIIKRSLLSLAAVACVSAAVATEGAQLFNSGWKFSLNDKAEYSFSNFKAGDEWQSVELPHDWSIALGTKNDPSVSDGATAYFMGGIGWYNKSFEKMIEKNQKCFIIFDGVYNNSEYWINGKRIGEHPYGYSPFYYDLTDYLKPKGQMNELLVRVDHSHFVDSRWYTGSGIYRDVEIMVVDKLHIPVWGTYITTPYVSKERATISMQVDIKNDYCDAKSGVVVTDIVDAEDKVVASVTTTFTLAAGEQRTLDQTTEIQNPALWGIENPNLYYAKSTVVMDSRELETRTTRFGVRSIRFDAATGFYLNGENMKIKGVCLHHDGGLVGSAVPKAVWKRRLERLKEGGCNAIRASHNPTSGEFLELCDELGMLVQQEFFDEWDNPKDKRKNMQEQTIDYGSRGYDRHFQEWAERDLKTTMLRDRNCPSVFQWSIGNEIEWTYPGNKESTGFFGADADGGYFWNQPPYSPERIRAEWHKQPEQTYDIGRTAQKLAGWVREMDLTRPVTANCILPSISYETGYIDALDVAGFSYRRVMYDYGHKHYPDKPLMGTENLGQWHEWKAVMDRPYVSGMFIWTGVDYLGEMGFKHGSFPSKVKECGLIDCAGFDKPSFHMMRSLWVDYPVIAIYSQSSDKSYYKKGDDGKFVSSNPKKRWDNRLWDWEPMNKHWNYNAGDKVIVELYSNCDEIELFQNGKSQGKVKLADLEDHIYKWEVTFAAGSLVAKGVKDGRKITQSLSTVGDAQTLRLTSDRSQMAADNVDVIHVVAELLDSKGREVMHPDQDRMVEFSVSGDCRTLGVDNGYTSNESPFLGTKVKSHFGRCMIAIQAGRNASNVVVEAKADGVKSGKVSFEIK